MAMQDLAKGIRYDPDTGDLVLLDESGAQIYSYNSVSGKTTVGANSDGKTNVGGDEYAGRLNPLALQSMGNIDSGQFYDDYTALQKKYSSTDSAYKQIGQGHVYADNRTEGQKLWDSAGQTNADQYVFSQTYDTANKALSQEDQSFFDVLKTMAEQQNQPTLNPEQNDPTYIGQIMNNPNLSDAVKRQLLGDGYPNNQATQTEEVPQDASVQLIKGQQNQKLQQDQQIPTSVLAPASTISTPQPVAPDQAITPDASTSESPDYTAFLQTMYDQFSPYIDLSGNSGKGTNATTAADPYASSAFNIGGTPTKDPVLEKQSASPDFNLGGYSTQSGYKDTLAGTSSGKGGSTQSTSQSSSGLSTGQFGSK